MRAWFYALIAAGVLPALTWAEEFNMTCAYGLSEYGVLVETNCATKWKDPDTGKEYCFSNDKAKQEFLKDAKVNIEKAEEAFAKLQKKQ